jgi:hypothetical protein
VPGALTGLTGPAITDSSILENSTTDGLEYYKADVVDWRIQIIDYLQDPSQKIARKVQFFAFKFTLVDGDLYHQIVNDLLLNCLDSDKAKVAMG